jgi:hypothetical protein
MDTYDHLLIVDEQSRELRIYRIDEAGSKTLLTSTLLPQTTGWTDAVSKFAKELGENLLLDSPSARRVLGL